MDSHNILPLLGLALRGGNLAAGEEPVEAAVQAMDARLILLAGDAADNTRRRVEQFARIGQCLWAQLPFSKAELGRALGRSTAAVAAVTDTGLANALGRRLASLDPERYGELSRRLELKARRARERRAEREARGGSLKAGKRRPEGAREDRREKAPPDRAREPAAPRGISPAGRSGGERSARRSRGAPEQARPPALRKRGARGGPSDRGKEKANPYARSRPVKKGKGSFRKREDVN